MATAFRHHWRDYGYEEDNPWYSHEIKNAVYRHVNNQEQNELVVRFVTAYQYTGHCKEGLPNAPIDPTLQFCSDNIDLVLVLISNTVWEECKQSFHSSEPLLRECAFDFEADTTQYILDSYEVLLQNEIFTNRSANELGYQFAIRVHKMTCCAGTEYERLSMRHHLIDVHEYNDVQQMISYVKEKERRLKKAAEMQAAIRERNQQQQCDVSVARPAISSGSSTTQTDDDSRILQPTPSIFTPTTTDQPTSSAARLNTPSTGPGPRHRVSKSVFPAALMTAHDNLLDFTCCVISAASATGWCISCHYRTSYYESTTQAESILYTKEKGNKTQAKKTKAKSHWDNIIHFNFISLAFFNISCTSLFYQ